MLATKFMNEEDEEEMKKELKEAFRLYDKNGEGTQVSSHVDRFSRKQNSQTSRG